MTMGRLTNNQGAKNVVATKGGLANQKSFIIKLSVAAVVLAAVIVAAVIVSVNLSRRAKLEKLAPRGLTMYQVCTAENIASDESLKSAYDPDIRCLTDDDRLTIAEATYAPLTGDDVHEVIHDQVIPGGGQNCNEEERYCEYEISNIRSGYWLKQVLDYLMHYSNYANVGNRGNDTEQLLSTIQETPTAYVYTYYLSRPAYAECTGGKFPPYVVSSTVRRVDVGFGEECGEDDGTYMEHRGTTRVGTIVIDKGDPIIKLTKGSRGSRQLYLDRSRETILVHDDTHYIDSGDNWCNGSEWCEDI